MGILGDPSRLLCYSWWACYFIHGIRWNQGNSDASGNHYWYHLVSG